MHLGPDLDSFEPKKLKPSQAHERSVDADLLSLVLKLQWTLARLRREENGLVQKHVFQRFGVLQLLGNRKFKLFSSKLNKRKTPQTSKDKPLS